MTKLISEDVKFFCASFDICEKFARRCPPTQTPTQSLKVDFRGSVPRRLIRVWYRLEWFLKLCNLSYSDLSSIPWGRKSLKPRDSTYLWIKLVFTKNAVFISSWPSFSQQINFFVVDILTRAARSPTFTPFALVRAKFFFWTSFKCTFGLFDGSFFFVRLFLNIIEPHPSVKWRGYTVSVLPEAGLITVGIILTGINWGWVEGKEVWCLPLWLFFLFSASCQRLIKTLVTSRD